MSNLIKYIKVERSSHPNACLMAFPSMNSDDVYIGVSVLHPEEKEFSKKKARELCLSMVTESVENPKKIFKLPYKVKEMWWESLPEHLLLFYLRCRVFYRNKNIIIPNIQFF